jgi:hypothetical protein
MSTGGHFRAHGRRQVDLAASLQRPPAEGTIRIRIVNLSLAGACIESGTAFGKGAPVTLEIVAPSLWDPLVLHGRVVWASETPGPATRAGLHFEHREAGLTFALYELLSAQDYDV